MLSQKGVWPNQVVDTHQNHLMNPCNMMKFDDLYGRSFDDFLALVATMIRDIDT